jgi:hypothetical protein
MQSSRPPEYTPRFYGSPGRAGAVEVEDGHVLGQVHIVEAEVHVTDSPVEEGSASRRFNRSPSETAGCHLPAG